MQAPRRSVASQRLKKPQCRLNQRSSGSHAPEPGFPLHPSATCQSLWRVGWAAMKSPLAWWAVHTLPHFTHAHGRPSQAPAKKRVIRGTQKYPC